MSCEVKPAQFMLHSLTMTIAFTEYTDVMCGGCGDMVM